MSRFVIGFLADYLFIPVPKSGQHGGHSRGFDVHAGVVVSGSDREGRERLLRYCARRPQYPTGQRPTLAGCRSPAPPARSVGKPLGTTSGVKPGEPAARPALQRPTDVGLRPEAARQVRRDHLLVAEIAELEELLAKTPRTATDRARLVLRLADDYTELAAGRPEKSGHSHRFATHTEPHERLQVPDNAASRRGPQIATSPEP